MKYLRLALVAFASVLGLVRAQDDQNRAPPTDIPDFSNLDEYIYEPKSTLILGMRQLSGAKTSFSGTGTLLPPEVPGPATGANIQRTYHDGYVDPDSRVSARTDGAGNPVIDPATNSQVFDPIAPDGHTNTWTYTDDRQGTEVPGYVSFHSYTADVTDTAVRKMSANNAYGVDIAVVRDMGSLFHTRASWGLLAGVGINDISAKKTDKVQAAITTITDLYSLDGQVLPGLPYTAPSSTSTTVFDSSGNAVLNEDGSTQTVSTDTTVLLGNQPVDRQTKTTIDNLSVTNRWKLKGAYFTFRVGPSISIPFTSRFRLNLSAGAALVYAGSDYTVTQTFQPDIGPELTETETSSTNHVMPAYFADASLQFDVTDHTGLFAGAVFQGSSSYTQKVETDTEHYVAKIDLAKQQGLRAGMTIRF